MLAVRTYLSDSKISGAGVGLFSRDPILCGSLVIDRARESYDFFSNNEFLRSSESFKNFLQTYASLESDGRWVLAKDNEKFMNHSRDPNVDERGYALKDILPGEEITCDYRKTDHFVTQNPPVWL